MREYIFKANVIITTEFKLKISPPSDLIILCKKTLIRFFFSLDYTYQDMDWTCVM